MNNGQGFYVWDIATLKVSPCGHKSGLECFGYGVTGYNSYVNASAVVEYMQMVKRPLGNLAAMSLNDRPADGKTDTHAGRFGREEALKQTSERIICDPRPGILDLDLNVTARRDRRSNCEYPRRTLGNCHCLDRVDSEVDDHLL